MTSMIRAFTRRMNDVKLRDKMLLSFLSFTVLPQVVLGFLMVGQFRQATLDDALEQAGQGVGRLERQTHEILEVGIRISDRLSFSSDVEAVLTTRYTSPLDVFRSYHDFETFRQYRDLTPEVSGIQAYVDNPTLTDNWEIRPLTPEVAASFWYQTARLHPNVSGWFSWSDETKAAATRISLVRYVPFPAEHQSAALVVDLDTSRIDSLLGQEGFETLVLDPSLMVVASSRPGLAGRPLEDKRLLALITASSATTFEREYGGKTSRVFLRDVKTDTTFNSLKIVCVVSPDVILRPADRIVTAGLVLIVLGALVSLLFLWVVYTLFARRLESLSRQLPLLGAGDFDQVLAVDGNDEIGQLASRFNAMVVDVRRLMVEVRQGHEVQRRLERAQAEIRLKMLSSQINPHFLFNVLESIRMKAHLRGEREISDTVKLLGRLMRRNLEASGGPIPLGEELENVRYYLEIEKFRLEEKLQYTIEAGPGAEGVLVPPLIVEPLVENAVVHGLERRFGGGTVTVAARVVGDFLEVSVKDNGLGMTAERQGLLLSKPEGHHVGLNNIHQRLLLTYGPGCGLTIESVEGAGTLVWFHIPLRKGG